MATDLALMDYGGSLEVGASPGAPELFLVSEMLACSKGIRQVAETAFSKYISERGIVTTRMSEEYVQAVSGVGWRRFPPPSIRAEKDHFMCHLPTVNMLRTKRVNGQQMIIYIPLSLYLMHLGELLQFFTWKCEWQLLYL